MKALRLLLSKVVFCIAAVICCFAIAGCSEKKMDRMIVKDQNGKYYQLYWKMGETYYLQELPVIPKELAK